MQDKQVLTTTEAAEMFGMSVSWFNKQRWLGIGPKYLKVGRSVRYRIKDLEDYFSQQEILSYDNTVSYCTSIDL